MAWRSPHPIPRRAVVIDPDAGRPKLIGSHWRRKVSESDEFDEVVIRGIHDNGPDTLSQFEFVVSPATFGPAITCTAESLAENFTRVGADADDAAAKLAARITELEARTGR
jgi:hypothetical protein